MFVAFYKSIWARGTERLVSEILIASLCETRIPPIRICYVA